MLETRKVGTVTSEPAIPESLVVNFYSHSALVQLKIGQELKVGVKANPNYIHKQNRTSQEIKTNCWAFSSEDMDEGFCGFYMELVLLLALTNPYLFIYF